MSQKIFTLISVLAAVGLIWFAIASGNKKTSVFPAQEITQSVRVENGVQVLRVLARGGYTPNQMSAKAGMPTRLEVETKGTYDCSLSFTIPSLKYKKMLPSSGVTTIDIPPQPTGSSLLALCSMGMYALEIQFN